MGHRRHGKPCEESRWRRPAKMSGSQPATIGRPIAAAPRLAVVGTIAVALTIVALHAIKPEFDPSWRFISEYAIGNYGWIMKVAFLIWAASLVVMALTLRHEVNTRAGKAGVVILFIVAAALML